MPTVSCGIPAFGAALSASESRGPGTILTTTSGLELLARLLVAGGLGALLGIERESRGHAAGTRTLALVAIGAAIFTAVGSSAFSETADTGRVAAQIVSGIGFLGAGVIIKNGGTVRGLTTAATLWVSAAIGMAAGAGAQVAAAIGVLVTLLFVYALRFARPVTRRWAPVTLRLEYEPGHGTLGPVMRAVRDIRASVSEIDVDDVFDPLSGRPQRRVTLTLVSRHEPELGSVIRAIERRPEMRRVHLET
jgi:putative Mg2+ transporter-C (MgtC) family protein